MLAGLLHAPPLLTLSLSVAKNVCMSPPLIMFIQTTVLMVCTGLLLDKFHDLREEWCISNVSEKWQKTLAEFWLRESEWNGLS